jgi:hypothetical protein
VQNFTFFVFPDFKDDGKEPFAHPSDGEKLFWNVGSPIKPVRPREQLPRFFKTNSASRIRSEAPAFPRIEAKTHLI